MAHRVETVADLAELVREDPALAREIQSRPAEAIAVGALAGLLAPQAGRG